MESGYNHKQALNGTNPSSMKYFLLNTNTITRRTKKVQLKEFIRCAPAYLSITQVMEKANNVYVIPSSFGWSDLGTWGSAYDNLEKDYLGNAIAGDKVMVIDSTQCMISAPHHKLLVLQGLNDFIVVDTTDVLLICKKDKEQEIKEYVAEVKRNVGDDYL
jgi:mannose-1-phosphate guanylyltransferase